MAGLVHSIEELVGRTPLMELDRFERQQQCGAHLLAKLEFFNPTGSVKDRAALSMLNAAEEAGLLKPGGTIVEQTSGKPGEPRGALPHHWAGDLAGYRRPCGYSGLHGGHRRHGFWHSKLSAQPQPESASGSGAAPSGLPPDPRSTRMRRS